MLPARVGGEPDLLRRATLSSAQRQTVVGVEHGSGDSRDVLDGEYSPLIVGHLIGHDADGEVRATGATERLRDEGEPGRLPQQQAAAGQRTAAGPDTERPDLSIAIRTPRRPARAGCGRPGEIAPPAEEDQGSPVGGPGQVLDRELLHRPVQAVLPLRMLAGHQVDDDDLVRVGRGQDRHPVDAVGGEGQLRAVGRDGQVAPCLQASGLIGDPPALDHGLGGNRTGAGEAEAEDPDLVAAQVRAGHAVFDVEGAVVRRSRHRLDVQRAGERRFGRRHGRDHRAGRNALHLYPTAGPVPHPPDEVAGHGDLAGALLGRGLGGVPGHRDNDGDHEQHAGRGGGRYQPGAPCLALYYPALRAWFGGGQRA